MNPGSCLVDDPGVATLQLLSHAEQQDILLLQQAILESVAQGHDPLDIINEVCCLEERLLPNAVGSVMLLDEDGKLNVYAAPSVPPEGVERLRLLCPGPNSGSCGNALYRGEPVFVSDTLTDPRWADLRDLAVDFNLLACWSMPIYGAGREIIGTFALSSFERRAPTEFHRKLLEIGASIIGIVLERRREADNLRLMAKVFENSNEGILVTDAQARIVSVNPAFVSMTGYSRDEALGQTPRLLASGIHDQVFYQHMWASLLEQGHWHGEIWNRRKNGEVFPEWLSLSAVHDHNGVLSHYVGLFFDLSERKAAEARAEYLIHHDPLTDLPNRLQAKNRLNEAIARRQDDGEGVALLYVDLDNFKTINDSLGQAMGDQLLKAAAQRMQTLLQSQEMLARHGADEFLLMVPHVREPRQLTELASLLLNAFAAPFDINGQQLHSTLSIGVALAPDDGDDYDALLQKAETAVRAAKEAGRNTFRFFTGQQGGQAAEQLLIRNGLHNALLRNEFILHYQPQLDLTTGRIVGAEALVRWLHPEQGMVPPGKFIPVAEESGLIVPIGEWVLHEACRQLAQWREEGLGDLVVAVNLSGVEFKRGNLVESVTHTLARTGLPATCLELELTESMLMHDVENVISTLQRLKALGVRLSIDDFGTGYSCLSYLTRFDVDTLKIDQSFVRQLHLGDQHAAIIRAVIQMAHSLDLATIAEGVEDAEVVAFLRAHACDQAQGYFFSKPLPAEDFARFVRQYRAVL